MKRLYEIDFVNLGFDRGMASLFCSLTGLEPDEIYPHVKYRMKGSDFKRIFRMLGYNTNDRFNAFDKDTEYPVVLRLQGKQKGYCYAFVYSNGKVYDPYNNRIYYLNNRDSFKRIKGKYFLTASWFYGQNLKITSMLQVWI